VVVPQLQYPRNDSQKRWVPQSPIHFFTGDSPGVKLLDVLDGKFEGMNDGSDSLFILDSRGIVIRIHVGSFGHRAADDDSSYLSSRGTLLAPRLERYWNKRRKRMEEPRRGPCGYVQWAWS